jgi:hypothetical protein
VAVMIEINVYRVSCAILAGVILVGCEQTRGLFGMNKKPPDEFAVVSRAPLSMPPDYGLRPPAPGTRRPQELAPRQAARKAVFSNTGAKPKANPKGGFSSGESAILNRAGALNANPNIRRTVDSESTALVQTDVTFLDKLVFWQTQMPPGSTVDPQEEVRRLREAQALGKAPNVGQVPTIKRKKKGMLEGIF